MKINRTSRLIISALCGFGLVWTSCQVPELEPEAAYAEAVSTNNDFGLRALRHLHAAEPTDNVFISPFSISAVMAMATEGARTETQTELMQAFAWADLSAIHTQYAGLNEALGQRDRRATLSISNSLWHPMDHLPHEAFVEVARTQYQAQVKGVDFTDSRTATIINNWVEDATDDMIQDMIQEIDPQTMLLLVNTLFFQHQWTYAFKSDDTRSGNFFPASGPAVQRPLMSLRTPLTTYCDQAAEVVALPYGRQQAFSMILALPRDSSIGNLLTNLTPERWQHWQAELKAAPEDEPEVRVILPRFSLDYETSLVDLLQAAGVERAFEETQADFSGIFDVDGLYISDIQHKTRLEVDESGTKAAAATKVSFVVESLPIDTCDYFRFDRPFLLFIQDNHSGLILFAGAIMLPAAA